MFGLGLIRVFLVSVSVSVSNSLVSVLALVSLCSGLINKPGVNWRYCGNSTEAFIQTVECSWTLLCCNGTLLTLYNMALRYVFVSHYRYRPELTTNYLCGADVEFRKELICVPQFLASGKATSKARVR